MNKFENSVHYLSFADRPAIEKNAHLVDSVILTSHLVAHGRGKVPTLLNNLRKDHDTRFYINPAITQLRVGTNFLDEEDNDLSHWFKTYIEFLGDEVRNIYDKYKHIQYEDLTEKEIESICRNTAQFQESFVQDAAEKASGKYDSVVDDLYPEAVIPWYHKITEPEDILKNRQLAEVTKRFTDLSIKPCIFAKREFITDPTNRQSLVESINQLGCNEVFLWLENYDKSSGTGVYLNVIKLVDEFSNNGIGVHSLYGSYFGHLLGYFGGSGVGFGVYHSESKDEKVEDSGGDGSNLKRYYFDPVKEFLNVADVDSLIDIHEPPVCECEECRSKLTEWDDLFGVGEETSFLQNHYISTRWLHKERLSNYTLGEALEQLEEAESIYADPLNNLGTSKTGDHLKKWRQSIEIFCENHATQDQEELLSNTV